MVLDTTIDLPVVEATYIDDKKHFPAWYSLPQLILLNLTCAHNN